VSTYSWACVYVCAGSERGKASQNIVGLSRIDSDRTAEKTPLPTVPLLLCEYSLPLEIVYQAVT
jgi:hypothetical protein